MKLDFTEVGHRKYFFFCGFETILRQQQYWKWVGNCFNDVKLEFSQVEHVIFLESCSERSKHQISFCSFHFLFLFKTNLKYELFPNYFLFFNFQLYYQPFPKLLPALFLIGISYNTHAFALLSVNKIISNNDIL